MTAIAGNFSELSRAQFDKFKEDFYRQEFALKKGLKQELDVRLTGEIKLFDASGAEVKGVEVIRDPSQIAELFGPAAGSDTGGNDSAQTPRTSPEQSFLDFSKMSDVEKLRMKELDKRKLTEEKLNEMSKVERAAVEEAIREKVAEAILQQTGKSIGGIADLTM